MTQGAQQLPGMMSGQSPTATRKFDYTVIVWVVILLLLIILVANPIFQLFKESFFVSEDEAGGFTFQNYIDAFETDEYYKPMYITMMLALSVGAISLVVGAVMAWVVSRTDIPCPNLIRNGILASFVTPPFLGAIAWIFLAGQNEGWLNKFIRWIFGLSEEFYLFDIFTMKGVIFAMSLYSFPLVFIVVLAGLNNISSDVEDAANVAGGGTFHTMFSITLPLVAPSLFAGFILAALEAMILFGIPAVLAIPAGQHTMTTQLRAFMVSEDDLLGLASAYAMPMLVLAIGMVWTRGIVLGRRGYATVGGKGGQRRPQKLGVWRIPIFILCMIPLVCAIVLPGFSLLTTSFMKNLGGGLVWANFTLSNYSFILTNDAVRESIYNTIILAIMAATGATIVAAVSAFIAQRKLIKGHQYLGFMATAPIGIPGIVLAVGLFAAYTKQPFVLYGTLWIMFLAYLTKYLPLAYQTSNAGLSSIHPELEESCRIMGANRLQVFKDVTIPLFKTAVIASWILVFMPSLRELSASVLLWTTNTKVISVVIVDFYEESLLGPISALGVLLLLITLVAIVAGFRLVGRDFMSSSG